MLPSDSSLPLCVRQRIVLVSHRLLLFAYLHAVPLALSRTDSARRNPDPPQYTATVFATFSTICHLRTEPDAHRNLPSRPLDLHLAPYILPTHPLSELPIAVEIVRYAHSAAESYDDFNARYADFFSNAQDLFELQRGLNNCFSYDLVPSQRVVEEALRACRRVNDFSTAVRVYEGLKEKTENATQYKQYVDETKALRDELGILLKEELYGSK